MFIWEKALKVHFLLKNFFQCGLHGNYLGRPCNAYVTFPAHILKLNLQKDCQFYQFLFFWKFFSTEYKRVEY